MFLREAEGGEYSVLRRAFGDRTTLELGPAVLFLEAGLTLTISVLSCFRFLGVVGGVVLNC
jgi:hypothetical protein